MIEIVPFEPSHLIKIDPPVMTIRQILEFTRQYQEKGPAFTGIEEDNVLGCGGIIIDGEIGIVWAFLSNQIRKRPMALHRIVKQKLKEFERDNRLKRIIAASHENFYAAHRWLESLGFKKRDIIENYGNIGMTYMRFEL
ncbi:MAG: hypothetical protein RIB59_13345 [Rhodospirillales bacterium]